MKAVRLGEETDKGAFIKRIIDYCKAEKDLLKGRWIATFAFELRIEDESWTFYASANSKSVSTRAFLVLDSGTTIPYPNTEWGGDGKRWDTELREFLEREVLKK